MALKDLIKFRRSYRRFYEDYKIKEKFLIELIDLARLSSSAANLQPLKYILSFTQEKNNLIFPTLKWAGYLKGWSGPKEGERPSAYIIILGDRNMSKYLEYDCGIAAQMILLGAAEKDLGGCMLGSMDKDLLKVNLKIPPQYDILLVIALGRPKEKIVIEKIIGNDIKYFRDEDGIHHVPKRSLEEVILNEDII